MYRQSLRWFFNVISGALTCRWCPLQWWHRWPRAGPSARSQRPSGMETWRIASPRTSSWTRVSSLSGTPLVYCNGASINTWDILLNVTFLGNQKVFRWRSRARRRIGASNNIERVLENNRFGESWERHKFSSVPFSTDMVFFRPFKNPSSLVIFLLINWRLFLS